jgi:hypothetical protein
MLTEGFQMKALKVLIDKDFEDDGLYAVTLWVDSEPPRYISISRDAFEEPKFVYVEAQDQIYGKKTKNLKYSLYDSALDLYFLPDSEDCFHWNNSRKVSIEIDKGDRDAMQSTLKNIFLIDASSDHDAGSGGR